LKKVLSEMGILKNDIRVAPFLTKAKAAHEEYTEDEFLDLVYKAPVIRQALCGDLIIPNFPRFSNDVRKCFRECAPNEGGRCYPSIPYLSRIDPSLFAVSICTISGQQVHFGDTNTYFALESATNPFNYLLAQGLLGEEKYHERVGREPSGRGYDDLSLNNEGKPHNPMVNSGALVTHALIHPDKRLPERFAYIVEKYGEIGLQKPNYNQALYLSEMNVADRNRCILYHLREAGALDQTTHIQETLNFYTMCCSLEWRTRDLGYILLFSSFFFFSLLIHSCCHGYASKWR